MPLQVVTRTRKALDTSRVPDALKVGTAVLASLSERRLLSKFEAWFPLSRWAGHGARGLVAFAVVFLLAGRTRGIRPFALEFETSLRRLVAPVAGLRRLPTASSMSRALGAFTHASVRACLDQLLSSDADFRRLLSSPHVQHRDAHGRGWHVLDVDPTVEAFRQRGLPDAPACPVSLVFPSTSYGYPTLRTRNPTFDPSNSRRSTRAGFRRDWIELGGIELVKIAETGHPVRPNRFHLRCTKRILTLQLLSRDNYFS